MPVEFNHVELFHKQLLYGALLGVTIVVWFAHVLARRDSDDWKKEYTTSLKTTMSVTLTVLLLLASTIFFTMFVIEWINSEDTVSSRLAYELSFASYNTKERWLFAHYGGIVLRMAFGFVFAALGCYAFFFRPSPRSIWVKIRKCIAYYLVFSCYMAFIIFAVERLYIMSFMPEKPGYKLGMFIACGIDALAIWLLLRHYKNEKYIPYKKTVNSTEATTQIDKLQMSKNIACQCDVAEQRPTILTQTENKKRMVAYYLMYEIILFIITFVLIIIEIVERYRQVGITIAIFIVLSSLPIGIYWILRLLHESSNERENTCL